MMLLSAINLVAEISIMDLTTISIKRETRNLLATIGNKDSTFDSIIQQLIKSWNEKTRINTENA